MVEPVTIAIVDLFLVIFVPVEELVKGRLRTFDRKLHVGEVDENNRYRHLAFMLHIIARCIDSSCQRLILLQQDSRSARSPFECFPLRHHALGKQQCGKYT